MDAKSNIDRPDSALNADLAGNLVRDIGNEPADYHAILKADVHACAFGWFQSAGGLSRSEWKWT
jgi:hypothetical protein